MSNPILNAPSEITQQLLIALGLGTLPPVGAVAGSNAWPVYATGEPNEPDNCITVYDTVNQYDMRELFQGQDFLHYGIQVRVRATDPATGWAKAYAIKQALLTQVGGLLVGPVPVTCGKNSYLVHCCTKVRNPLVLGKDTGRSKRSLFTVNGFLVLAD